MGIVTGAPQNHASKIQIKYYLMENIGDYWINTEFLAFPNYKGSCTLGLGGNVDATIKKMTACHTGLETFQCLNYAPYKFLRVSATEGGH